MSDYKIITDPSGRRSVEIETTVSDDQLERGWKRVDHERDNERRLRSIFGETKWRPVDSTSIYYEGARSTIITDVYSELILMPDPEPEFKPHAISDLRQCEDYRCGCHAKNEKGQPKAIHVQFEREREIRMAFGVPASDPETVTIPANALDIAGNVVLGNARGHEQVEHIDKREWSRLADVCRKKGDVVDANPWAKRIKWTPLDPRRAAAISKLNADIAAWQRDPEVRRVGELIGMSEPERETDDQGMSIAAEQVIVTTAKDDERRAIVIGEARSALSKLREWPTCRECHNPLYVSSVYSTMVELRCKCGPSTHRQVAVKFSERATRALKEIGHAIEL